MKLLIFYVDKFAYKTSHKGLNSADDLDVENEIKNANDQMMQGFAESYQADKFDDAREWIRKLQFLKKAKNEVNTLIADVEDELMH